MALEPRKNKTFYYHKQRVNGHVVSTYIRDPARIAALNLQRAQRARQKQAHAADFRALRERIQQLDTRFTELDLLVTTLTRATLLVRGCHTHKGQWRRKNAQTPT